MYTYNPVSCLAYIPDRRLIVSGSSGGKVELWDPETGENVQSSRGHEDAVTCFLVNYALFAFFEIPLAGLDANSKCYWPRRTSNT